MTNITSLNRYYVSGTVPSTGALAENKTDKVPALREQTC